MPFQTQVKVAQAPAVAGDFASHNPRSSALAGPGGLVAGAAGVTVGRFAWIDKGDLTTVRNLGAGLPDGLVHREQKALITTYLGESSVVLPPGFAMTLFSSGEFWVKNDGTVQAVWGMKAFANEGDGRVLFGAAGSSPGTAASATGTIAAATGSFTGSITDNIFTVTVVGSGVVVVGGTLAGGTTAAGTKVTQQLSGTTGGIGTYAVNIGGQAVASGTITETYGIFTAVSGASGAFAVGDVLTGTGVTAGTAIESLGTGTGGLGTYNVSPTQTVGSTAISAAAAIETKYYARSAGAAGELVKISSVAP